MTRRRGAAAVVTRQFDPGTEWKLEQARDLVDQGYSVDRVEQLTGWPRQMLLARARSSPAR